MRTQATTAYSTNPSLGAAIDEIEASVSSALEGRPPDLLLVFASTGYDQSALVHQLTARFPNASLAGCSGEGVISSSLSEESPYVIGLMAIASETISFSVFLQEGYGEHPKEAGSKLAQQVNQAGRDDAQALVVLPDGICGNCTDFLDVLRDELSVEIPVVGGTSADQMTFSQTFQYSGSNVTSGGVSAVLLCGDVDVRVSVSHGCAPIGTQRTVTRSRDGWVDTIDGQPAWDVYKEYLGDDAVDLNAEGIVHLCLGQPLECEDAAQEYDQMIIRTPLQLNSETGALFFPGGTLEQGSKIQLTRRDQQKIRDSAEACAKQIRSGHPDADPEFVLQFDCAGRGGILFGACAADEIVTPLQKQLGENVPWLGFHTFGEIAPIAGKPYYHNYTVALCAIYDRTEGGKR